MTTYRCLTLTKVDDIVRMKSEWDRLYVGRPGVSFAQSFDWNYGLISNELVEGTVLIYLLYRDDELILIAPLQKIGCKIQFLGREDTHSDYLDFLYSEVSVSEMRMLIRKIQRDHPFSSIEFSYLNTRQSSTVEMLSEIDEDYLRASHDCYHLNLPSSVDDYRMKILSGHSRRILNQKINKLAKTFSQIRYESMTRIESNMTDEIFKIYERRMTEKLGDYRYNPRYIQFFKDYLTTVRVCVILMYLDDILVAFRLGIESGDCIEELMGNHDPDYSVYGIGSILLYQTIISLIENRKTCIDLGRGNKEYKISAGATTHLSHEFRYNIVTTHLRILRQFIRNLSESKRLRSWFRKLVRR